MFIYNNHNVLFGAALVLFLSLTVYIAVYPAIENQKINHPLPRGIDMLSEDEKAGKMVYLREGCVACHTQQVRNVEMDNVFGKRPSIAADYSINRRTDFWRNTANLLGTQRTGPDLTTIGERQPSIEWHLIHLYQPRAAVEESIMPAYPWHFEEKTYVTKEDIEVKIPEKFLTHPSKKIIASRDALQLVAYLLSLKQVDFTEQEVPLFLYKQKDSRVGSTGDLPDGAQLYTTHCATCHQTSGEGVPGAFPSLKESPIITGGDLELIVTIIMKGYDPRPEYASMPAVGENAGLNPEELTAIINHERNNWGNDAKEVTVEEVKNIMDQLK